MNKDLKYMPVDNRASSINNNGTPFRNHAINKMNKSSLFNNGKLKPAGSSASGQKRTTDGDYEYLDGKQVAIKDSQGGSFKPTSRSIKLAQTNTGDYYKNPEMNKQIQPYGGSLRRSKNNLITGFKSPDGSVKRVPAFDESQVKNTSPETQKLYKNFQKAQKDHNKRRENILKTLKKVSEFQGKPKASAQR